MVQSLSLWLKSLELSPFLLLRSQQKSPKTGHRVQHCKGPSVRQQRLQAANDHLIQVQEENAMAVQTRLEGYPDWRIDAHYKVQQRSMR